MSTAPTTPDTTDTSESTALPTTRPTPGALPAPGFAADTWNVMTRELRPMLREPASVLFAMVQPLVFLALFAPLLPDSSAFGGSALQWFVPGIIAMTALMGASMTGSNLTLEINTGSHERLLVSPLRRSALLVGRALKEVVPMLAQGLLIVAVVTPFDFELHPAGVLVGLALLSLFSVGVGALSFALAVVSAGQDWIFWTVQQTVIFPLLLLAGVLLPLDGAPGWLQLLADLNPLGYIVEAERALLAGTWPAGTIAAGAGSAAVVAAIGLVVGLRTMRRSS